MPEAATEVINSGIEGGNQHPWKDEDYHIKMYQLIIKRQLEAQNSPTPIVFFDKGHLDGISYIILQKRKLFRYILDCVQTSFDCNFFQRSVFFIENLSFIIPSPARTESIYEYSYRSIKATDLPVRVHDLKHTFDRRLRTSGVSFEDRQDLLGHKSRRITTHYSTAELLNLWEAANKVCEGHARPTLTLLKTDASLSRAKVAQSSFGRITKTSVNL